jgi:hypothetical protein
MIFIRYSHKDEDAAGALDGELQAASYSTFLAHDDVPPPSDWHVEIWKALQECHAFVGLLTEDFNSRHSANKRSGRHSH